MYQKLVLFRYKGCFIYCWPYWNIPRHFEPKIKRNRNLEWLHFWWQVVKNYFFLQNHDRNINLPGFPIFCGKVGYPQHSTVESTGSRPGLQAGGWSTTTWASAFNAATNPPTPRPRRCTKRLNRGSNAQLVAKPATHWLLRGGTKSQGTWGVRTRVEWNGWHFWKIKKVKIFE